MKENVNDIMDEFEENNSKKKKFSIRMDITMDKEMSYETAERTIMNALSQAGMIGHCGGINQDLVEVEKMNDEMKKGMLLAYQSVKEEMDTIKAELKRKGIEV